MRVEKKYPHLKGYILLEDVNEIKVEEI